MDVAKNPNFDEPWLFLDVMLPKEELYMPPLNVRMRDRRSFGRTPIVGSFAINELEKYFTLKTVTTEELRTLVPKLVWIFSTMTVQFSWLNL